MVSDSAKKRLEAKKAAKSVKLHGSAKPSPSVSQSQVSFMSPVTSPNIPDTFLLHDGSYQLESSDSLQAASTSEYMAQQLQALLLLARILTKEMHTQSEANLDQFSKENGLGGLDINGKEEKNILDSQRAVTGVLRLVVILESLRLLDHAPCSPCCFSVVRPLIDASICPPGTAVIAIQERYFACQGDVADSDLCVVLQECSHLGQPQEISRSPASA